MAQSIRYGYGRVSSKDQHLNIQKARLEAICHKVYMEKVSGKTMKRPELQEVLWRLGEGDVLVVIKLDRLARSAADLYHIVGEIKAKGATLEVLDQPMDLESLTGKIVFGVLGLVAELETSLRHERQMAGIRAAQAKGDPMGRPKALKPAQVIELRQKRAQGALLRELMQEYHLGRTALCRYLKEGKAEQVEDQQAAD